jgi:hypothetical protein
MWRFFFISGIAFAISIKARIHIHIEPDYNFK